MAINLIWPDLRRKATKKKRKKVIIHNQVTEESLKGDSRGIYIYIEDYDLRGNKKSAPRKKPTKNAIKENSWKNYDSRTKY